MKTLVFVGIFFLVCFAIVMLIFAFSHYRRGPARPQTFDVHRENARTLYGDNTK